MFEFFFKSLSCCVKTMSNTKYSYYSYWKIFDIEAITLQINEHELVIE